MTHIFIPCFIDQLFPQTAVNMVTVLKNMDCDVQYNPNQTCCGQPALNAGYWDEALEVAQKFVDDFCNKKRIVCPSASCVGFVKNQFPKFFEGQMDKMMLDNFTASIFEFSEFLINHCNYRNLRPKLTGKAMYHDSCAALRECNIREEPRKLLQLVEGLELLENPKSDVCCGFGGTFATKFEPISVAMAEQKVQQAIELGVDYIISTDLSCLMHLNGYIQKNNINIQTMHLADVLVC
jgi:L-lactate dehydrogenase complex protein LldE